MNSFGVVSRVFHPDYRASQSPIHICKKPVDLSPLSQSHRVLGSKNGSIGSSRARAVVQFGSGDSAVGRPCRLEGSEAAHAAMAWLCHVMRPVVLPSSVSARLGGLRSTTSR